MQRYIARRILLALPTFFVVTVVVFASIRFLPGNTVDALAAQYGGANSDVYKEELRHELGLDRPAYEQYFRWLGNTLRGDLGDSFLSGRPVMEDFSNRLPASLELGFFGILVSLLIGLPIGIIASIRQDTWADYLLRGTAVLALSLPPFWLGTLLIVLPSVLWQWSPPLLYQEFRDNPVDNLYMLLFPALVLGIALSGTIIRVARGEMLDVLRQDYVRTARAKGLSGRTVVTRHALKNALIPVVTLVGTRVPIVVGGTVILERIFNIPGVGTYLLTSIDYRDYPAIQAIDLFIAGAVIVSNLTVDVLYARLDPRIQY